MTVEVTGSDLITPTEAADYLHISASTLARWRTYGGGPLYIKLGGRVFYRIFNLDEFIAKGIHAKTKGDTRRA